MVKKLSNVKLTYRLSSQLCEDALGATRKTRIKIGFKDKQTWKSAKAHFDDHSLMIQNHPVMEDWERPYMKLLAEIASSRGGAVLEVGYGMGISANFIQENHIKQHIIIEANHEVAEKAREFATNARYPTKVLEGFWEEIIDKIPDESFDGILFDTYPLSELEIHKNHFYFFHTAYTKLKKGGVFTYYSDEINGYSPEHLEKLINAGFNENNINGNVASMNPPMNCEYWQANTMLAPIIVK